MSVTQTLQTLQQDTGQVNGCEGCHNSADPITLDELSDIPREFLFRISDDKVTYCFDIRALYEYYEQCGKLENPLTRTIYSQDTLQVFLDRALQLGLTKKRKVEKIKTARDEQQEERDRQRELDDIRAALGDEADDFFPQMHHHHHHHRHREREPDYSSLGAHRDNPIARAMLQFSDVLDANPTIESLRQRPHHQIHASRRPPQNQQRRSVNQRLQASQQRLPVNQQRTVNQRPPANPVNRQLEVRQAVERIRQPQQPIQPRPDMKVDRSESWRSMAAQHESMLAASRPDPTQYSPEVPPPPQWTRQPSAPSSYPIAPTPITPMQPVQYRQPIAHRQPVEQRQPVQYRQPVQQTQPVQYRQPIVDRQPMVDRQSMVDSHAVATGERERGGLVVYGHNDNNLLVWLLLAVAFIFVILILR